MNDTEKWCEEIYEDITRNKKRLVFIAGASCSGKGTNTDKLVAYLQQKGVRALHIEADMYYKGVARIITEKVLERPEFKKYQNVAENIYKGILSVNYNDSLQNKFKSENIAPIVKVLNESINREDIKPFLSALNYECNHMNFDEPSAINFGTLANDLKALLNCEKKNLLKYSFNTSECNESEQPTDGSDYDVYCVEGLYMLRPEILNNFDKNQLCTSFIDCDPSTLLSRRLFRDIQHKNRTSMLPKTTIDITLHKVMPAYFNYILPTKSQADHIFDVTLTPYEMQSRKQSRQVKYKIDDAQYEVIQKAFGKCLTSGLQMDKFFVDKDGKNHTLVRLRSVDGYVNSLTLKYGDDTLDRRIDNYNLRAIFGEEKLSAEDFGSALVKSGFKFVNKLEKYNESYVACGLDGLFMVKLNELSDHSKYVELDNASNIDENEFVERFGLADKMRQKSSYVDLGLPTPVEVLQRV